MSPGEENEKVRHLLELVMLAGLLVRETVTSVTHTVRSVALQLASRSVL